MTCIRGAVLAKAIKEMPKPDMRVLAGASLKGEEGVADGCAHRIKDHRAQGHQRWPAISRYPRHTSELTSLNRTDISRRHVQSTTLAAPAPLGTVAPRGREPADRQDRQRPAVTPPQDRGHQGRVTRSRLLGGQRTKKHASHGWP
jgi:hypothetical protein